MKEKCPNPTVGDYGAHDFKLVKVEGGVFADGSTAHTDYDILFCSQCGEIRRVVIPNIEVDEK